MSGNQKITQRRITISSELASRSISLAQIYQGICINEIDSNQYIKYDNRNSIKQFKFSQQASPLKIAASRSRILEERELDQSFCLSNQYFTEDSLPSINVVDKFNDSSESNSEGDSKKEQKSQKSKKQKTNQFIGDNEKQDNFLNEALQISTKFFDAQIDLEKIIRKHHKLSQRNPFKDPYYVQLKVQSGYNRLNYELSHYHDKNKYLKIRKYIVYLCYLPSLIIEPILLTVFFKLFMTVLILCNVGLFIFVKTNRRTDTDNIEQVITILFLIEIGMRIIASGIILNRKSFFRSPLNIYDFLLVILTTMNLYRPDIIIIDLSPFRMLTLLNYLGDILKGLSTMLKALKSSVRLLLEALIIVGLFSLFFGVFGVLLFQNLFNYRCQFENGEETEDWIQCVQDSCPEGMKCLYSNQTPKLPTSFNNIVYALGQILRTITMDDWSWVMFFTMRIYHPYVWIYYLLIIFVGGFFGFNLVIAVLKTHYAEAAEETVQEERQQEMLKRLKEKQENPERDLISIFDVAILRHIGIYQSYKKYHIQLQNVANVTQKFTIEKIKKEQETSQKPRTLSGKQTDFENRKKGIQDYLESINLKYFLLPKLKYLEQLQKEIKPTNFTDDPLELKLIHKLLQYDFCQLKPYPNFEIYHEFSSVQDILQAQTKKQQRLNEQTQKQLIQQRRSIRLKQTYSLSTLNLLKKQPQREKFKLPLKKQSRFRNVLREDQTLENSGQNINVDRQESTKLHHLQQGNSIKSMPFSVKNKQKTYVFIQEQYIDYEAVSEKINAKIQIIPDNSESNEFRYGLIRKKEMVSKTINKKNWSGRDVLYQNLARFISFDQIKKALNHQEKMIWLRGISGKIQIAQKYTYIVVSSKFSDLFFDLIILFNFVFLSLQGIVNPGLISQIEDITTICLCIEIVMKLFSFNCKELVSDWNHIVQILIVSLNFVELTLGDEIGSSTQQGLRLIRGTKCLLFYRCLKYNKMAAKIGWIAQKTFEQYIYLTFLMFLVIFMYALIGMEMYAGMFDQNDTLGQLHSFDNIIKSFMTIFNIMTNDDWYGVYVMGGSLNYNFALIYSYSMVIILNYLTYGLVLAIMLDGFGKYLGNEEEILKEDEMQNLQNSINSEQHDVIFEEEESKDVETQARRYKLSLISNLLISIKQAYNKIQRKKGSIYHEIQCQQSLYIFDKSNWFRIGVTKLVISPLYIYLMDGVIYWSIVVFIIKTYHDYEIDSSDLPDTLQLIVNILIIIDFLLNIISKGLILDRGSHIQSIWQIVDIIYIIAYFIQYHRSNYAPIVDVLMFLGYFRPMILMYRISWLIQLRAALAQSLVDILNVLITLLSVWFVFGVYGIILYENQFGFCEDKMEFYVSYEECQSQNRTWVNYKHNFDNITVAIPTLFVVSTFDGWGEILQVAENSQIADIGPVPFDSYLYTYFFLIIFCFIGSMFFLSLFTGVLFTNLKENQFKMQNNELSQVQREFKSITNIIMSDFPIYSTPPKYGVRKMASDIVNNHRVKQCIFAFLIMDLVILLLFRSEMDRDYFLVINSIHHSLTILYLLWIILMVLALGVNRFFDNNWRRFYFFLILVGMIDLIAHYITDWTRVQYYSSPNEQYYQLYRFFFALRSLRIILIFQGLINIQRLIRVMAFAVPYLVKIFTILIITMFIFALFGCQLYGKIDSGQVMDDLINFTNFGNAMLALFKCASGDDWRTIMTDTMQHNPLCQEDPKYCGSPTNQLYFILFMLLSNYVLLNLFVLGLIEQFEQFFQMQNSQIQTYVENVDDIKTIWCKYTTQTQGKTMHYKFLGKFLMDIGLPLGVDQDSNLWDACKLSSKFKLQCDSHGYIQYNSLMYELFRRCFYQEVFTQGTPESIKLIKQFNKEQQFRLKYYRKDKNIPRTNIGPAISIQTNINLLREYLNVLILFKTWQQFSKSLIKKVNQDEHQFTDSDISLQNPSENGYQRSQNHILQEESQIESKQDNYIDQLQISRHSVSQSSQINQYNDLLFYKGNYETSLQSENRDFTFLKTEKRYDSEL
ncbi:unnamed protein product (macronuclear) [Paramecium tetraurelia]|uniref:Ion transport domain-containing protein n=1 Tax=Paramecium tetraurelia TaxID=5888 RepID=A0CBV7_PARTE|nr:uncharacterized protein GSPATT00037057001 [Paramecium tetraurelia]CAK68274.1 unnamed protein product [Paramecium tetraurelia]|eukprot:XP_001435671.1 hypothetical protein (macronuclear) [Paramecium tetraurelia strain d4-2]